MNLLGEPLPFVEHPGFPGLAEQLPLQAFVLRVRGGQLVQGAAALLVLPGDGRRQSTATFSSYRLWRCSTWMTGGGGRRIVGTAGIGSSTGGPRVHRMVDPPAPRGAAARST